MQILEKWLRSWIDPPLDTAALAELLTMSGLEVEDIQYLPSYKEEGEDHPDTDAVLVFKITPNRADCLSIKGLAREVSALTQMAYQPLVVKPVAIGHETTYPIHIDAPHACGRYVGRIINGITQKNIQTPDWMRHRLESSGFSCISVIVDITHYVLLELGQPLHAFDGLTIEGAIHVRMAKEKESLHLISGKKVLLNDTMLVIADDKKLLALAGIMGGMDSKVTELTHTLWLESAFFDPKAMAQKARQLGLDSEAAYRFERGVDPQLQREAIERATALIVAICGGSAGPLVEQRGDSPPTCHITLRSHRVEQLLGVAIENTDIAAILSRLALPFSQQEDIFLVTVPSFRFDLAIEEDLIEEIARFYGYNHIPVIRSKSDLCLVPLSQSQRAANAMRHLIMARDYQEVINYAFIEEALDKDFSIDHCPVKLLNPIDSKRNILRSTLLGGLVKSLVENYHRQHNRIRLFEIANTFRQVNHDDSYQQKVAWLAWGSRHAEQWGIKTEPVDFYDIKLDVEALITPRQVEFVPSAHPAFHPNRSADIVAKGIIVGILGELSPQLVHQLDLPSPPILCEIDFEWLCQRAPTNVCPLPKLLPVERDLALVVDATCSAGQLLHAMLIRAPEVVAAIVLFDVYQGKSVPFGKKSMAYRITLQPMHKTLTEEEINAALSVVLEAAISQGASLRA